MSLSNITCPVCGKLRDGNGSVCPFCGSSLEHEIPASPSEDVDWERNCKLSQEAITLCSQDRFDDAADLIDSLLAIDPHDSFTYLLKFMCKKKIRFYDEVFLHPDYESFSADEDFARAMQYARDYGWDKYYLRLEKKGQKIRARKKEAEIRKKLLAERRKTEMEQLRLKLIADLKSSMTVSKVFVVAQAFIIITLLVGCFFVSSMCFVILFLAAPIEFVLIKDLQETKNNYNGLVDGTIHPFWFQKQLEKKTKAMRRSSAVESHPSTVSFSDDEYIYQPAKSVSPPQKTKRKEREIDPEDSDDIEEILEMLDEG